MVRLVRFEDAWSSDSFGSLAIHSCVVTTAQSQASMEDVLMVETKQTLVDYLLFLEVVGWH